MNVVWWMLYRLNIKRSRRAARRSIVLAERAEKFFRKVKGVRR